MVRKLSQYHQISSVIVQQTENLIIFVKLDCMFTTENEILKADIQAIKVSVNPTSKFLPSHYKV